MAVVDWDDPCVAAGEMKAAYYRLLTGQQETEFQYLANGVQRVMRWQAVDLKALIAELARAEADCAAKQGLRPVRRRFAIQGGARG